MNYVKILTRRFILRELTPEDTTVKYLSWFEGDSVKKYIQSVSVFKGLLERLNNYIKENVSKRDVLFLGIFLKNELLHIGNIKFNFIDSINNCAVLGVDINNTKAIGTYSKAGFKFEKTKYVEIIDTSNVSMVLNIL